jgi:hypothetical protein
MAAGHSIAGLLKWVRREEWREDLEALLDLHLAPACAKAKVKPDDIPSLIGDGLFTHLWGCVVEDFFTWEDDDGRNIVDDYLKRRGWKESASNKAYMAALRTSVMSLYEISDVVPGEAFLARDLVRGGDPVRVSERTETRQLKQWDRIAARIVPLRSKYVMSGGVLPFDHEVADKCLSVLRGGLEKAHKRSAADLGELSSDNEMLPYAAYLFTSVWLADLLDGILHPRMPELRNSDGDELLFTTVRYPLAPGATADAVRAVLGRVAALHQNASTSWDWIDKAGCRKPGSEATAPGQSITTFTTDAINGSTILGNVQLKEDALVLSVNSRARAERAQAMLAPVLAGLVSTAVVESKTPEQMRASATEERARPAAAETRPAGLSAEEERAIVHEHAHRHYVKVLDEKVAMLGNQTPRQAATTASGRDKLVAWLKYLENQSASHDAGGPMAGYDFRWLWDELGIADLRR